MAESNRNPVEMLLRAVHVRKAGNLPELKLFLQTYVQDRSTVTAAQDGLKARLYFCHSQTSYWIIFLNKYLAK